MRKWKREKSRDRRPFGNRVRLGQNIHKAVSFRFGPGELGGASEINHCFSDSLATLLTDVRKSDTLF